MPEPPQQLRGLLYRLKRIGLSGKAVEVAARLGWTARGALYFILGALATLAAVGEGGGLHDGKGVVRWVMTLPAGTLLVAIAGIGFAGYALYSAALLIFGEEDSDSWFAAVSTRSKGAIGVVVYGSLALTSVQLLLGHYSSDDTKRVWIATLLMQTWGRLLLGLVALVTIGFGLYQLKCAADAKHREEVSAVEMSGAERTTFLWVGRIGLAARGIVLAVIGYFTLRASIEVSPSRSTSTADALEQIRHAGWAPLATIAVGLAAYGILQLFYARYRRVELG